MKIYKLSALALLFFFVQSFTNHGGDKYSSNTGNINFFSHTDMEDIKAENHKVKSAFLSSTGKIQFVVLIKDFVFDRALMQEHFNENYLESDKYPKSTFSGTINNVSSVNFEKDGIYKTTVTGDLTMKDVTKSVTTNATFVVKGENVNAKATFHATPEDYNIEIPNVVRNKIAKDIEISVNIDYTHSH